MKQKFHSLLINPLLVILPLIVLLLFGWQQYLLASQHYSLPVHNLLPNAKFTQLNASHMPDGWQLENTGSMHVATSLRPGHVNDHSLQMQVSRYSSGDATVLSPIVNLNDANAYLYKGYYSASAPFSLLLTRYYEDGSSTLTFVQNYAATGNDWSTVATTLKPESGLRAAQIAYRLTANGRLQLDGNYLQAAGPDVFAVDKELKNNNWLAGVPFDLSGHDNAAWRPFATGDNKPSFDFPAINSQGSYTHIAMQDYKKGEAKWQYPYVAVHGGQRMCFSYLYRSDTHPQVIAEFVRADGSRSFRTIANLTPATRWTIMSDSFEVPADAKQMVVAPVLKSDGYLDGRGFGLYDISKNGEPLFKEPVITVAFDGAQQTNLDHAVPALQKAKLHATFYLNPLTLDTRGFITTANAVKLQNQGYEIAGRSSPYQRFNTLSSSQMDEQMRTVDLFSAKILNLAQANFATGYGEEDPEVRGLTPKYFASVRGTDNGINTRQMFRRYNLRTLFVSSKTTHAQIQDAINQARLQHGWLILTYQKVESGHGSDRVSPAEFQKQLQQVQDSGLPVKTTSQALRELLPQL